MAASRFDLTGRVAVVIGGTSGLGLAMAHGLAECGACVVPTGRRMILVEQACREVEAAGGRALRVTSDATGRASLERLRDAALGEFGRVDILINSAGRTVKKPAVEITDAEWFAVTDAILNATYRACQVFYEPLKQSGHGRVINIASLTSHVAFYQVAPYGAAKAAVLGLTRQLACEWARDGITVNAIAPGVFPTELNADLLHGTERGREILLRTPMRRFGRPDEVAGAAILLASDAGSFITGECIAVDGGYLASGVNT